MAEKPAPEGDNENTSPGDPPEAARPEKEKQRSVPAPVETWLNTHSLPDRYTLALNRINPRSSREESVQVYQNYFPDMEEIGRDHGPGQYQFIFSFYNTVKKKRDKWDPIEFILAGDHFEKTYSDEKERKENERLSRLRSSAVLGGAQAGSPLTLLKEASEILNQFGGGRQAPAVDLAPLSEAIRSQGDNFRAALEAMNKPRPPIPEWLSGILASTAAALTTFFVGKLSEKKGEEDPMGKAMDRLISVGEKLGLLKDLASPKEPDKWDRMIGLAEVIFPPLFERLSNMPAAARKDDPTVKMITSSEGFQDLMKDPDGLKKFMATFYEKFGARRTVIAMEACGMKPSEDLKKEAEAEEAEEKNAEGGGDEAAPGAAGGAPGAG